jgi:mono/diheme cytochrome c family protein
VSGFQGQRLQQARVTAALLALLALWAESTAAQGDAGRGRNLFALAGGCGCHTAQSGPVGAGGRELPTPFGTFYSTNITPDKETGIGAWSNEQIIAAIRDGDVRGKGVEAPVMPYYRYSGMTGEDVADLVAYLRTLPAVRRANREAEVSVPFARLSYRLWRLLFAPAPERYTERPGEPRELGRYLTDHVSICGDCHTPRNFLGVPRRDLYLAGTADGPFGARIPNLTPARRTGIGDWTEDDVVNVLSTGMLPNFDNVQGLMDEVVEGRGGGPGYRDADKDDLRAIATYVLSVPAIEHKVGD